ncbi:protease modulator HflC [Buchnera aphidicola (Pemphigus obesinymphae)]|uniref:protease modulator HflC n=1 Tax=Buchnera aphidicola TaxID=9 RepID=UPI00223766B5|nr:protease modulator HflC [Buchnera aphidicola]MCW5196459.1 protease modulator HflC [Buchnera aphidicola (Pemphigus obesinymphae)]
MNRIYISLLSIFCFILCTSFFLIKEEERGIILRFGKIVQDKDEKVLIYKPGLHLKLPLIDLVKKINIQLHTTENRSYFFTSKEKKNFIVDFYIRWKINDFGRYYLVTEGNKIYSTEIVLKRKFNDILNQTIKKLNKNKFILYKKKLFYQNTNKIFNFYPFFFNDYFFKSYCFKNNMIAEKYISSEKLISSINLTNLGIKIIDVSIKKINLSAKTLNEIYNLMILENKFVSNNETLKGQIIAKKIKLDADYKVMKILSDAQRKGLLIRETGEITSLKLLSDFFIKEPHFYRFLKIFEFYRKNFCSERNLIINADNIFLNIYRKS